MKKWFNCFNGCQDCCTKTTPSGAKTDLFPESDILCHVKFSDTADEVWKGKFHQLSNAPEKYYSYIFMGKDSNGNRAFMQCVPFYKDPVEILVKGNTPDEDYNWSFFI